MLKYLNINQITLKLMLIKLILMFIQRHRVPIIVGEGRGGINFVPLALFPKSTNNKCPTEKSTQL